MVKSSTDQQIRWVFSSKTHPLRRSTPGSLHFRHTPISGISSNISQLKQLEAFNLVFDFTWDFLFVLLLGEQLTSRTRCMNSWWPRLKGLRMCWEVPNDLVIGESVELHSLCPVATPLGRSPKFCCDTLKRNQQTTMFFSFMSFSGGKCLQFCYSRWLFCGQIFEQPQQNELDPIDPHRTTTIP